MANARKCDRCGRYYDLPRFEPELKAVRYIHMRGNKIYDLCEDCTESLEQFLINQADIPGGVEND